MDPLHAAYVCETRDDAAPPRKALVSAGRQQQERRRCCSSRQTTRKQGCVSSLSKRSRVCSAPKHQRSTPDPEISARCSNLRLRKYTVQCLIASVALHLHIPQPPLVGIESRFRSLLPALLGRYIDAESRGGGNERVDDAVARHKSHCSVESTPWVRRA